MPLTFPVQIFNPANIKVELVSRVIATPESINGNSQAIRTDGGGYWRCGYENISLIDSDTIRCARAWDGYMGGGGVEFIVPVADIRHAPRPEVGGRLMSPGPLLVTGSDPYFPEALGYASPVVVASAGAAALRATSLNITVTRGTRVKGGQYFSVTHPTKGRRMYRTGRVLSRVGQSAVVEIDPPLREAISADTSLDFDWPSFLATLVPETDTGLNIFLGRSAQISYLFREAS